MENPPIDNDNQESAMTPPLPMTKDSFPWENEHPGFFERFFQTLFRTCVDPWKLFAAMPVSGGYRKPLVFLLICTVISCFVTIAMLLPQIMIIPGFSLGAHQGAASFYEAFIVSQVVYSLLGTPMVFVMLFVFTPITQGILILLGGAKNGFEATLRTQAYCTGLWGIVALVPCVGSLVCLVWGPIVEIIALKKAQETDYWRAVIALVPMYFISFLFLIAFYLATWLAVTLIMAPEALEIFNF